MLARGFSARLRLVFEKNWFDSATRSSSTMRTLDRYVTFGVPSAAAVAMTAGTTPSKHSSDVGQRDGARSRVLARHGVARTGPGRLVVELLDSHVTRDEVQRHEPFEQPAVGAVGRDDVGRRTRRRTPRPSPCPRRRRVDTSVARPLSCIDLQACATSAAVTRHPACGADVLERARRRERRAPGGRGRDPVQHREAPAAARERLAVGRDRPDDQRAARLEEFDRLSGRTRRFSVSSRSR